MIALPDEKKGSRAKADAMNQTDSAASQPSLLLHADRLKQLYAALLRSRASGKVRRGREAILAAAALELGPDDHLLPRKANEVAGRIEHSPAGIGDDESFSDTSRLALATGLALGLKKRQQPGIVTVLVSEAEPDGELSHVFSFAAQSKLPIIYLLDSADIRRPKRKLHRGTLPVIFVEGSDAVAILRVIQECARRARQGHGPALIECSRPTSDPLKFMEEYLRKREMWSEDWRQSLAMTVKTKAARETKKKAK